MAAADGFSAGPSIGDLPQDETPSRTLVVRNLDPGTNVGELQRAFEVGLPFPRIASRLCMHQNASHECLARELVTLGWSVHWLNTLLH